MDNEKINLKKTKTYSIKDRKSKTSINDFVKVTSTSCIVDLFPDLYAGRNFREIVHCIKKANLNKKPVIFAFGAHVIKCGLSLIVIDLIKRGIITFLSTTGAGAIHDIEIALWGKTSEYVDEALPEGRFGWAKETSDFINKAINKTKNDNRGYGEIIGEELIKRKAKYIDYSIFASCYILKIPITCHISIGTDINQMHPTYNAELSAKASYRDFLRITNEIKKIGDGGILFNVGSAVILPEVILKSFSIVCNLGYDLSGCVGINFDMIKNYRADTQVVQRIKLLGGKGYSINAPHEILLPLLYYALIK